MYLCASRTKGNILVMYCTCNVQYEQVAVVSTLVTFRIDIYMYHKRGF